MSLIMIYHQTLSNMSYIITKNWGVLQTNLEIQNVCKNKINKSLHEQQQYLGDNMFIQLSQ